MFSAACGGSAASNPGPGAGRGGNDDAGAGGGGSETNTIKLAFDPARTDQIPLKAKQNHELTVRATPAGSYRIRFALVGDDAADAVLDASEAETDAEGVAHVVLTAPSKPATFSVRASSPNAAQVALQGVIVSALGFTTLRVQPVYSGRRPISAWTATAQAGVYCSDLAGNPPPDGEHIQTAKFGAPLAINKVPVGRDLAVTARAGHYIGGCVNVPALSEGDGNQVLVYTSDRPMNLGATNLLLNLGATLPHPGFDKLLEASASLAESALLGSAKDDVAALLDGMRDATSAANREAFKVAREAYGWDYALSSAFGKNASRRMRDPVQRWLTGGLAALDAPDALVGQLQAIGSGALLTPKSVAKTTPSNAGFPGSFVGTWSADSDDTLLLGIDLNWEPTRLVTALAVAPARTEFPEATSAERALSLSVDCAQVGQVLLSYGVNPGSAAFASCDRTCAENLCGNAVAAAWNRAQLSSGTEIATLSITATGTVELGDAAEAVKLDGSWVGELRSGAASASVSGALSASSGSP